MAIDFPASPTVGQTFTSGGRTWVYSSGGTWDVPSSSTLPFDLTIGGSFTATNYDVAGKNKIINGGFDIWQRGNGPFTDGSAYGPDRWRPTIGGSGISLSYSKTTDAPVGFKYSVILTQTGVATTSEYAFRQPIEQQNTYQLAGKTVTLSFWYKSSIAGTHGARVIGNANNTGGIDVSLPFTVNAANTWEYKQLQFSSYAAVTAFTGSDNAIGGYVDIGFRVGNAQGQTSIPSGATFQITGVQLELGSVATPFSRAGGTYQGELAACQRYYETGKAWGFVTKYSDAGTRGSNAIFKVSKRATPTMSVGSYATLATSTTEWYGYVVNVAAGSESILTWTADSEL